mgnify:CR=1 FL=1
MCIRDSVQRLIADEAYREQRRLEAGEKVVVGLNKFATPEPAPDVAGYELDPEGRARQLDRLAEVRRTRDARAATSALDALGRAAAGTDNLMPLLVDCALAYCTLGEMVGVLKDAWGEFQQPVVF